MADHHYTTRKQLDNLFCFDSVTSVVFGMISLLTPHGFLARMNGGNYNKNVHETLRLYGCLRIALGWILFHIRHVDDGRFRRSVCEALCFCYALQSAAVLRAQLTSSSNDWTNWIALIILISVGTMYGRFRFGQGGDLIKVYELPSSSARNLR